MFDFILAPILTVYHNIIKNCQDVAEHAPPIDWSGLGGVPWLIAATVGMLIGGICAVIAESRRERATARAALYREAETQGHLRQVRRDWYGYSEH
jgi:hypothetical protein